MKHRILGKTGLSVSIAGFGAAALGNDFGELDTGECTRAVHCAIDKGIDFFDTSPYYGRTLSETRLGQALEGRRHNVTLATKCGRYGMQEFDFTALRVFASVEESLTRLRTDYLDLFQAHDIEFGDLDQVIEETVPAMQELKRQGKVRFIGVTGYQLKALRRVAEAVEVDTVLSYCRYNPLITDEDELLTPFAQARGLGLINGSPLLMGLLTDAGPPRWHPASDGLKQVAADAAAFCRSKGINIAELALQFALGHSYAATTLSGLASVEQVENNVRAAETPPDPESIAKLCAYIRDRLRPLDKTTWPVGRPENEDR